MEHGTTELITLAAAFAVVAVASLGWRHFTRIVRVAMSWSRRGARAPVPPVAPVDSALEAWEDEGGGLAERGGHSG